MNSTHVNIVYGHIGMGYYWAYSGQTSSIKNGNTNIIYIYAYKHIFMHTHTHTHTHIYIYMYVSNSDTLG